MSFLNNNDSKGARLSSGALLGAVALHMAALLWLITQPQPSVRLPEVLEFALLEPTAQLEKVEPRPHPAPAQPPRAAPAAPAAAEPEPQRTEQALAVAPTQTAPTASAKSEAAPPRKAVTDAQSVTAAESLPEFDAAYLHNATPDYPALSRRLQEEGRVMLQVRVNPQGLPVSVVVQASSGFNRLDSAAREAVKGWRFVPARRGAIPIEATVLVPLVFNLES